MPDESCRKCGGILKKCSLCAECRKVTQHICVKCGSLTMDTLHINCFYSIESIGETRQSLIPMMNFELVIAWINAKI